MFSSTRVLKGAGLWRHLPYIIDWVVLKSLYVGEARRAGIRLAMGHVPVHHAARGLLVGHIACDSLDRGVKISHPIRLRHNAVPPPT